MRQPRAAAVAGGSGATTVAAALGAQDLGVYRGGPVEVLVCRDTVSALGAAHRAVQAAPGQPVLVVVASTPASMPRAAAARLQMVRPHVAAAVQVPFVSRWREVTDPHAEAAALLRRPPRELPRHLRSIATALHRVREVLVAHGRAGFPEPPPAQWVPAAPPNPIPPWAQ